MTEIRLTVELTASAELLSALNEMVAAIGFHAKALSQKTDELVADIIEAADRAEIKEPPPAWVFGTAPKIAVSSFAASNEVKKRDTPETPDDGQSRAGGEGAQEGRPSVSPGLQSLPETDPPRARAAPPRARVIGTEGPTAGAVPTSAPAGPSWATLERIEVLMRDFPQRNVKPYEIVTALSNLRGSPVPNWAAVEAYAINTLKLVRPVGQGRPSKLSQAMEMPKGPIDTSTPIVASLMQIAEWASPRGITVRTASDVQTVNERCRAIGHRPFALEPPRNGAR
jgi:hypothetical protein